MRHILGALALLGLGAGQVPAWAAGFAIDPDPNSATLGELLDREARRNAPRPALKPMPVPPPAFSVPQIEVPRAVPVPRAESKPIIPRGAVTVLAPRVRARAEPVPPVRKIP